MISLITASFNGLVTRWAPLASWAVAVGTGVLAIATYYLGTKAKAEGEAVRAQAQAVADQVVIGRQQLAAITEQVAIGRQQLELQRTPRLVLGRYPNLANQREEVGTAAVGSVSVLPCYIELVNAGSAVAILTKVEVRWRNAGAHETFFPAAIPAGAGHAIRAEFMLDEYLTGTFDISVEYQDADGRSYKDSFRWDRLAGQNRWRAWIGRRIG